ITPEQFKTFPCPTYPEIRLAILPGKAIQKTVEDFNPDYLHIATEGPLGWAARRVALSTRRPFTTAYHTKFPEYVKARFGVPLWLSYAVFRWFHKPAKSVMVATPSIEKELRAKGFQNIKRWSRGVDLSVFNSNGRLPNSTADRPKRFLFAGRVAVEKNIEAFLRLDLPGEKWIAGDGPQKEALQIKYPDAKWLGMLKPDALAQVYREADVFVFPSLTDTFGLVMLEAMACGLPVAAYPVAGPVDVVTSPRVGALNTDLKKACIEAAQLNSEDAIHHANGYTWGHATGQFLQNLHLIKRDRLKAAKRLPHSLPTSAKKA
ncbi:MAG: glycosyltransferase family 1 protein, partial [Limnobacter sp.]|nr:glycosyltransferase family 1 protein [Limnobacter sp.]